MDKEASRLLDRIATIRRRIKRANIDTYIDIYEAIYLYNALGDDVIKYLEKENITV